MVRFEFIYIIMMSKDVFIIVAGFVLIFRRELWILHRRRWWLRFFTTRTCAGHPNNTLISAPLRVHVRINRRVINKLLPSCNRSEIAYYKVSHGKKSNGKTTDHRNRIDNGCGGYYIIYELATRFNCRGQFLRLISSDVWWVHRKSEKLCQIHVSLFQPKIFLLDMYLF